MWFSTDDGINRFDGLNFTIFSSGNKNPNQSLLGANVFDIAIDSSTNYLWVLTFYGGLNKIDISTSSVSGRFALNDSKSGKPLQLKCLGIEKNNIFIGTNEGIAIRFNSTTNKIEQEKNIGEKVNAHIDDIFIDNQNRVWLFLSGYGIMITDSDFREIKSIPALQLPLEIRSNVLFEGHAVLKENLLLATSNGLKIISINDAVPVSVRKIFGKLPAEITRHEITAISEKKGKIILCGKDGIYALRDTKRQPEKIVISRNYEDNDWSIITHCMYQTDQSIWIGSEKGVRWIKNKTSPFNAIYSSMNGSGIKLNNCWALYSLDDSTVIACAEDGLYKVNHITDAITKYNSSDFFVLAFNDLKKNLLACSYYNGLKIYDKDDNALNLSAVYPELLPIKNDTLVSCQLLGDSLFFLASFNHKGMYIWNIKRKTIELKNTASKIAPLQDNEIKNLCLDSKKRLWILCDNAISIYNPINKMIENLDLTIPGKNKRISTIMDICELNNHYWLACYGTGIVELDNDYKIKNIYGEKEGLNNSAVFKIFALNDSCVIVSSNVGLSVLNINSKAVNNYFEEDGLQSDNFNETSGCRNKDYLFLGGINGFTKIDMKKLTPNKTPPQFYFAGLKTETKNGFEDTTNLLIEKIKIPNNWLQTNISFAGINYLNPDRVTYAYRIKELDDNWINLGTQSFVTLIGLSPDTYTLEVKAANVSSKMVSNSMV